MFRDKTFIAKDMFGFPAHLIGISMTNSFSFVSNAFTPMRLKKKKKKKIKQKINQRKFMSGNA